MTGQRSRIINVRVTPQQADVLAEAAAREGVSVSDVVRQAVEDRVATRPVARPEQRAAFDPFGKLATAARGSLEAQRELARKAVEVAFERDADGQFPNDPEQCLIEGLVFARLAAAQGDLCDQGLAVCLLSLLNDVRGGDADAMGEAVARLSLAADHGADAVVCDALPSLAEEMPAEVMALAQAYTARLAGDNAFTHAGTERA